MELARVNELTNLMSAQKSKPTGMAGSVGKSLTDAEQNMIDDQFPTGSNKKLELYMNSGDTRTEQPASKGGNLDFRI